MTPEWMTRLAVTDAPPACGRTRTDGAAPEMAAWELRRYGRPMPPGGIKMQPYVVKQGDFLARLAYQSGFDATTAWNDPANQPLRDAGRTPDILAPGDIVYIPAAVANAAPQSLSTGTTNTFVSDQPTVTLTLRFLDSACASQACTIDELPSVTGLVTDASGNVTLSVPVTTTTFTVTFASVNAKFACRLGHVDPVGTRSGVLQRLQNLGYIDPNEDLSTIGIDELRAAVRAFKAEQAGGASPDSTPPPDSAGGADESSPPSSGAPSSARTYPPGFAVPIDENGNVISGPGSDDQPPSSSGAVDSAPPSSAGNSGGTDAPQSQPSSGGGPDSQPSVPDAAVSAPDSAPPSSAASDNSGLSDNGLLDDATAHALVAAHGS
jgi:hypothetical protein